MQVKAIDLGITIHQAEIVNILDRRTLVIELLDGESNVEVEFDNHELYVKRNESYANRTLSMLDQAAPGEGTHWIYELDRSDLLNWFHEETHGIHASAGIKHYIILTYDEVLDVLSASGPRLLCDAR